MLAPDDNEEHSYDAVLIASFGGPNGPDDVMPFLENVLRGRNVPEARKLEVAKHYEAFGGVSPINRHNRELRAALERKLAEDGMRLPVYLGNRNWHPLFSDTLRAMATDGIKRAVACFPSGFSCYSSCRQYWENIDAARAAVGETAPVIDKIRAYYNHPRFVHANVDSVRRAWHRIPESERFAAHLVFTAHSIPVEMAANSDYVRQLHETGRLVAEGAGIPAHSIAYQSRSGPPHIPWLEPDINDHLTALEANDVATVIVLPIGFLTDHIEVQYDLDTEAANTASDLGLNMIRAETIGLTEEFVTMLSELIQERMAANPSRPALGTLGPHHVICPPGCCRPPSRGR